MSLRRFHHTATPAHLRASVGLRRRATCTPASSRNASRLAAPLAATYLAAAVATAALLFVAVPAQAIVTHSLSSTFGSGLNFPQGIAVDNSSTATHGEVYVADAGDGRVAKFKADGTPDGEITSSNITGPNCTGSQGFSAPAYVAVDPSTGYLYVSDPAAATITAFDPSGACLFQINPSNSMPAGASTAGVAVDPTSGPDGADGTIYAADYNHSQIDEFDASIHTYTGSFPVASYNGLRSLALDSAGHLYITDWQYPPYYTGPQYNPAPPHGIVAEYDPTAGGAFIGTLDRTNAQAVAVDHSSGQVFVEENGPDLLDNPKDPSCYNCGGKHSAYNQLADFRSPADSSPFIFGKDDLPVGPGAQQSYGIAVNDSTDTVYLTDPGTGVVHAYGPGVTVPDLTTGTATTPDHASAVLHGHLDPDSADAGTAITTCYFQFGTDTTYTGAGSGTVPCSPDPASSSPSSNFSGPTDVTANLSNLQTFTTYHYRLVATSTNNVPAYGADQTVRPPPDLPTIDATSASAIGQTTATIDSQINPGFGPTVYRVEYGTATSYGSYSVLSESIGSDGVDHSVSTLLSNLTPATVYHYRVRAINFSGPTLSSDHTFNTTDLPGVSSTSSSVVTSTTATLAAQINPDFSPTTYHFDYGVGTSYGSSTPESAPIGSDHFLHPAAAVISGLVPATTYHYRVLATNADGTSNGPDQTFTTTAVAAESPQEEGPAKCKRGFVRRHGKCVKKKHQRQKHHNRSAKHG